MGYRRRCFGYRNVRLLQDLGGNICLFTNFVKNIRDVAKNFEERIVNHFHVVDATWGKRVAGVLAP